MKREKNTPRTAVPSIHNPAYENCAFRAVVFLAPGPDDSTIAIETKRVAAQNSLGSDGGGLGYLTLAAADFRRLWKGVERGEHLETARAVLSFLGPDAKQFIDRVDDFIFGWTGADDKKWGDYLLLEIFPRPIC